MYKKMNTGHRLSEEVAEHIKMLIRNEHLKPGDKIPNELELGRLFGVSRPTIREAVNTLVSQNIVGIERGKGTFVSKTPGVADDPLGLDFVLSPNLRLALNEARLAVEPGVARLAAENCTDEDIEKIGRCLEQMESVVHEHRLSMTIELDFHRSVAEASKNPVIMRIVPIILDSILRTYADSNPTLEDHRIAFQEHRAIYEAIRHRNLKKAQTAMQQHLENSYHRALRRISYSGDAAGSNPEGSPAEHAASFAAETPVPEDQSSSQHP